MGKRQQRKQTRRRTYRLRMAVLKRDDYTCQLCYSPNWHIIDLTVDHIVPAALGGKTELWNLRTACRSCHAHRHKILDAQMLALRRSGG
jgi:5-methylcytosine-specific restriction endonuclease McrA